MNEFISASTDRIRIALIDTGVDGTHPDFQNATLSQYFINNGKVEKANQPEDLLGHGTACAGIIHKLEPMAEIISIQCLDWTGTAYSEQVLLALEWCIKQSIDIVNLSFGALSHDLQNRFSQIGAYAAKNNVLLFASCHDSGYLSVPACLPEYLAVLGKSVKGRYTYFYQANRFIAHGGRQRVAWLSPRFIFAEGSSFATARMSAIAARVKRNSGIKGYKELINTLVKYAQPHQNLCIPSIIRNHSYENNSSFFQIHDAAIYSFTKEMHPFFFFSDLSKIQIQNITDPPLKKDIGKRISQILPLNSDLKIYPDRFFEENIKHVDTVIISRTSSYESLTQRDCLKGVLEKAVNSGKNIYSLEYIDADLYPEVYDIAKKKQCHIRHPMLSYDELYRSSFYRDMYGHIGTKTPIIGIFGTGPHQGKFSAQLMLRRLFKKRGYTVNNYGTETHCELFGFEGFYPLEMDQSIKFSQSDMISFIQGDVRRLEVTNHPDIIIVGGQSGLVPYSYALKSSEYTLPTLMFLMETLLHIYILAINPNDDFQFILDTIHVLEGLGKGQTIALICRKCFRETEFGSEIVHNRMLSSQEYEKLRSKIYLNLGLPLFDIFERNEAEDLVQLILSYFCE